MTNQEAIKRIKEHIAIHKYRESHAIHIVEALEMAISALQAQANGDCISRRAAIEAMCSACGYDCDKSEFVYNAPQDEQVILCPEHYCLCNLPSAQTELPEWAQKVEEYRQSAPQHIYNPLAWALYQVWKEYAG